MRLQAHMVEAIGVAQAAAFREARSVPTERLDWRPLGMGQSVLSMARELAKTPDWALWVLTDARPDDPESAAAAQKAEMESWTTIDACDAACRSKLEALFAFYLALPVARLTEARWLPFNGGRDHTVAELLEYPRWNFTYHAGQIAYVRSLFEKEREDPRAVRSSSCIFPGFRR